MSELRTTAPIGAPSSFVVVDLGKKQKRKSIKQLRKGTGKLTGQINELLEEMREQGTLAPGAQPVVIVVREKRKRDNLLGL